MVARTKVTLTDLRLKALKPAPVGKRYVCWDAVQPHLGVRVTERAAKSFIVVRRRPGDHQPIYHVLGQYPGLSLADARKQAAKVLGTIAEGVHPAEVEATAQQERERRRRNTITAAVESFIEDEKSRGLRTASDTEAVLQREFLGRKREGQGTATTWLNGREPIWRDRPAAEIERREIISRLDEIKRRSGKHAARHALSAIRKFFNWCEAGERFGIEVSPAARIRDKTLGITGRDLKRRRVLDDTELRDVWQAAKSLNFPIGQVVRLLALTGQRLNDIASAKWGEIDLDNATLTVPATRYKTGIAQQVPLAPQAVSILRDLPRFTGPFVFTTTAGSRPVSGFSKFKQRLDAAIAKSREKNGAEPMPSFTLHDIRRSVRTRLVGDCGVEAFIAERVLGHALPGLHGVYDQGTHLAQKRDALARWERSLLSIVEPEAMPPAAIADFSEARRVRRSVAGT